MLWEIDCSGLQSLSDVWKMAMEDFFPHLADLRILILIYGLRFHGFRGAWSPALQGQQRQRGVPRGRSPSCHRRMLREVPQRPGPRPPVLYITSEMSVKDFNPWNFFALLPPTPPTPSFPIC